MKKQMNRGYTLAQYMEMVAIGRKIAIVKRVSDALDGPDKLFHERTIVELKKQMNAVGK
jgi:hypothetical protein